MLYKYQLGIVFNSDFGLLQATLLGLQQEFEETERQISAILTFLFVGMGCNKLDQWDPGERHKIPEANWLSRFSRWCEAGKFSSDGNEWITDGRYVNKTDSYALASALGTSGLFAQWTQ